MQLSQNNTATVDREWKKEEKDQKAGAPETALLMGWIKNPGEEIKKQADRPDSVTVSDRRSAL